MAVKADMERAILGTRIRQRRRETGLTQVELARRIGISASYLNLIEWNKRRIAGSLLRRTAEELNLGIDDLEGSAERRLFETLTEVAHLPELSSLDIEDDHTGELIGRFPGWARAMAALARSEREATVRAQTLSDRLSNDPFLSETVHRMLTRIAAIRSAADSVDEASKGLPDLSRRLDAVAVRAEQLIGAYGDRSDFNQETLAMLREVRAACGFRNECRKCRDLTNFQPLEVQRRPGGQT